MRAPVAPARGFTMVALGDSLTQGMQDACVVAERQDHCYSKVLADHAGITYNLPYVSDEGIPFTAFHDHTLDYDHFKRHVIELALSVAPLALWTYFIGAPHKVAPTWELVPHMGKRTPESRDTVSHPQHNFAVSGFELRHLSSVSKEHDMLDEVHNGLSGTGSCGLEIPLVRATLGNGQNDGNGSEVKQALSKNPDLILAWGGNNDALSSVFNGRLDDAILTPVEDRKWTYWQSNPITGSSHQKTTKNVMPGFRSEMLGLVNNLLQNSDAEIMLMNIPDVTAVALARELGKPVGKLPFKVLLNNGQDITAQLEAFVIPNTVRGAGNNGRTQFPPGSRASLVNVLKQIIATGGVGSADELRARLDGFHSQGASGFLAEDEVLDNDEIATVSQRISQFNAVIDEAGKIDPRVHVVDIHGLLENVKQGRPLKGAGPDEWVVANFTGAPDAQGRDGIFSYDGVHPSDTGHAVVANLILDKIQKDLGHDARFAAFHGRSPIDEKAVHHADPHTSGQVESQGSKAPASIVLDNEHLDQWLRGSMI
jgi:lysophospholipase L1-like esterase